MSLSKGVSALNVDSVRRIHYDGVIVVENSLKIAIGLVWMPFDLPITGRCKTYGYPVYVRIT
jgi:hypothetical protein